MGWGPGLAKGDQNFQNMPSLWRHLQKTPIENEKLFFSMSTRRLAESVEGLNSSLALAVGDLWPKKGRPIAVVKGLSLYTTMHRSRCACLSLHLKWSPIVCILSMRDRWAKYLKKIASQGVAPRLGKKGLVKWKTLKRETNQPRKTKEETVLTVNLVKNSKRKWN